jgi:Tol biopolymer transport system component
VTRSWDRTLLLAVGALLAAPLAAQDCKFELVDVSTNGLQGNAYARYPRVSGDGRFVTFESSANNLVAGDTNQQVDLFLRDLVAKSTERVNVGPNGEQATGWTQQGDINHDGRYVLFATETSFFPQDQDGLRDIYLRDRQLGTTEWISVPMLPGGNTGESQMPSISADGRYVAYVSNGDGIVPGDNNGAADVFLRDRVLATTVLVSQSNQGVIGDWFSSFPSISADGRTVAFLSQAQNFHPSAIHFGIWHVYLRDIVQGTTTALDLNASSRVGNGEALAPITMSADGQRVAFFSKASDLDIVGNPGKPSLGGPFVWISGLGIVATEAPKHHGYGGGGEHCALSGDGRFITLEAGTDDWVAGDPTPDFASFLHDLLTGVTSTVGATGPAGYANSDCELPRISWDGSTIAFVSQATNLVAGTIPILGEHVFVRICDPTQGMTYCYPTQSPAGCLPALVAKGQSSATLGSGHTLDLSDAVNGQVGIFIYGTGGPSAVSWNGGHLCVAPPFIRMPVSPTGGTPPPRRRLHRLVQRRLQRLDRLGSGPDPCRRHPGLRSGLGA